MTVNLPKEIAWLGPLPPDYAIVRLGFLVSQVNDKNIGMRSKNLLSLSYGNIKKRDIQSADGLLPESFETYNCIKKDDIVLRMTDLQNDKRSLRSAISTQDGIITSAYITLRCKKIYPKFLAYYLRCLDNAKVFYSMGSGLRQSLTWDDIRKLPVAVPPLDKQKRIADELDRELAEVDEFIADVIKLQKLIEEREVAELEKNLVESATEFVELRRFKPRCISGTSVNAVPWQAGDTEFGVLKTGVVSKGYFDPSQNKAVLEESEISRLSAPVKANTIIVNRANSPELVGSAAYVEKDYPNLFLSDKLWQIDFEEADNELMALVMQTQFFKQQVRQLCVGASASMQNLSYKDFLTILLPVIKIGDYKPSSKFINSIDEINILLHKKRQSIIWRKINAKKI